MGIDTPYGSIKRNTDPPSVIISFLHSASTNLVMFVSPAPVPLPTERTNLLNHTLNLVTVLHFHILRSLIRSDTLTINQKPHSVESLSRTVTVSLHELLQRGRALDLEEHLIVTGTNNLCIAAVAKGIAAYLDGDVLGLAFGLDVGLLRHGIGVLGKRQGQRLAG
ncbi:hypothetical protein G7K_0871-t1 [Saitoella complicata NRRL Y-17804]|uniref:Uncharacterized protein n=1 Tax=Saitoella complicata (strain BCRC 22490 / CBS 7301 / JCM 7358 / NBRC 10748 / NRRL Y-17804) TaxID=698492 RepID=A0A0E9NB61_SAICN|nr:hypothetical protein G7K_0871-t1 [Saitoella complicata NRRL Y-17804]